MKTKYLAFAALAALMLAGCSNEDENFTPQVDNLKDKPITVSASVGELATRAGHDEDNLPGAFYLTVIQEEDESPYNYTNVEMTKEAEGNTYTPTSAAEMLWKDESPISIYAYTTTEEGISVPTDQSAADGSGILAADLLGASYYYGDINVEDGNIGINFRHLLCKLDVTFSWGSEFASVAEKSITSVVYSGLGRDATLNFNEGRIYVGSNYGEFTAYLNGMTSEAIFAPQIEEPEIFIYTMIDGKARTFSLELSAPATGFESGNRYTMNVTIGGTAVDNVSATVAGGWGYGYGDNLYTE